MSTIPQEIRDAWATRSGPVIFTTADGDGKPNAIYATCTEIYEEEYVVVADNYFQKTKANILNGCTGSILFISEEKKAYQLKGTLEYHREGPLFEDMKRWNPVQHPGHAAAALKVKEIYSGSEKIL